MFGSDGHLLFPLRSKLDAFPIVKRNDESKRNAVAKGRPLVLLVVINLMTSPGHSWVQWAALGIGSAWVVSFKAAIGLIGLVLMTKLWNQRA